MDQSKIYNYLSGEASEAEVKQLFQWIEASPENRKTFIQYKKAWALTSYSKDDPELFWKGIDRDKNQKQKNNRFIFTVLKYAAAAILVFSLGVTAQYFFNKSKTEQLYSSQTFFEVPAGQMSKVNLPDGTVVHLNSESKLFYDNDFSLGKRNVEIEGEAFFEVKTDKEHPFIVSTPDVIKIKVYGTAFNIRAYPNEPEINTTLVEGSVGILDQSGKELTKLEPGENARYLEQAKRIRVSKVNTEFYTSWKEGLVTFRNESLEQIALKIERWYNVEIVIENPQLANELYNGTIMKNKPIDQILEVFRLTSSLEYEIVSRTDKPTLIYWK